MSNSATAPLLFAKLPRHVVEKLQSAPPNEIQLVIGGKERTLNGTIIIGSSRYDVRYSNDRATAPSLLFQGGPPKPASSEGWASWTRCGKLMGALTFKPKSKLSGFAVSGSSNLASTAKALKSSPTQLPDEALLTTLHAQASSSAAKSPPQKKSGIVRHNRELLRDRVLHMLALAPMDELDLVERLKSSSSTVLDVLAMLAKKIDTIWTLLPEQYKHVQIESWMQYNDQARERVVANALAAFDMLGLAADNPERQRVLQIQKRLTNTSAPAQSTSAGVNSAAPLKGPTVPSISLPKDVPTPKKKPVRSVIAPTLPKKLKTEPSREAKRLLGNLASSSGKAAATLPDTTAGMPASTSNNSTHVASGADASAREPLKSAGRPARPVPTSAQKPNDSRTNDDASELHRAVPESADLWNQTNKSTYEQRKQANVFYSVPVTANAGSENANSFHASPPAPEIDSSPYIPQNRPAVHGSQHRRPRGLSDSSHQMIGADSEYRRQQWAADTSSPPASRHGRSRSRSNSRNLRAQRVGGLVATAAVESAQAEVDKALQHVPVRSRPLKAPILEIQEKLVHSIAEERVHSTGATISERTSQGNGKYLREASLSPTEDLGRSCTPSPAPLIERVETIEDLKKLRALLTTTYAEYSQLRLKIDNHYAEYASLIEELDSARAACTESVGAALNERKSSEADREEGEEVLGDAPVACELAMTVDPTIEKCAPDGSRLYWAETDSGAWLADSAEAVVGACVDSEEKKPTRMRKLLPDEARVLRANQAIVDQYRDLDSGDVRHWVKRYLRLRVQIEQMSIEVAQAHERLTNDLLSQFDALRDGLGDNLVDDAIAEANDTESRGDSSGIRLTIDAYRDDLSTVGAAM
ncbi:hypothetical protein IWW37_005456 [Coemansia sp. RSA 2050]|nr:hypothetical protein IWW37_005456 [Coemansia sp. RSA 2050]KAJ2730126.1 hypothetical protein IW152_005383 [Coemansia sp. BCRC 34962]